MTDPGSARLAVRRRARAVVVLTSSVALMVSAPAAIAAFSSSTSTSPSSLQASTLAPPVNLNVTSDCVQKTVSGTWPAATGAAGYRLERWSGITRQSTVTASGTSAADTAVPDGSFTYRLYSTNNLWASGAYASKTLTVSCPPPFPVTIQAESHAAQLGTGQYASGDTDGGVDVGGVGNGDYLRYDNVDFNAGLTGVAFRVASDSAWDESITLSVRLGSRTATPIGSVTIWSTYGWSFYELKSGAIARTAGVQTVYITASSTSAATANLNWLQFTP